MSAANRLIRVQRTGISRQGGGLPTHPPSKQKKWSRYGFRLIGFASAPLTVRTSHVNFSTCHSTCQVNNISFEFHWPIAEGGSTETGSAVTNSAMSEVDSTTTAVVIFVVIVGLGTMVAVCLAWKRRSKHVKDNFLSGVAAPKSSSTSSVSVQITRDPQPLPASENGTLSSPVTYPIFRYFFGNFLNNF